MFGGSKVDPLLETIIFLFSKWNNIFIYITSYSYTIIMGWIQNSQITRSEIKKLSTQVQKALSAIE